MPRIQQDLSGSITPDDRKLEELILYVSDRLSSDQSFGDTKLNKVLFYSDFTAYVRLRKPITGHRYKKQAWGPVVHVLLPVRNRMVEQGLCIVRERDSFPYRHRITVPLRPADLAVFTSKEIAIVDEMIDLVRPHTAKEISDISHNFVGWKVMDIGDDLHYETAFLSDRPLTKTEKDWAEQIEAHLNAEHSKNGSVGA